MVAIRNKSRMSLRPSRRTAHPSFATGSASRQPLSASRGGGAPCQLANTAANRRRAATNFWKASRSAASRPAPLTLSPSNTSASAAGCSATERRFCWAKLRPCCVRFRSPATCMSRPYNKCAIDETLNPGWNSCVAAATTRIARRPRAPAPGARRARDRPRTPVRCARHRRRLCGARSVIAPPFGHAFGPPQIEQHFARRVSTGRRHHPAARDASPSHTGTARAAARDIAQNPGTAG